MAAKRKKNAPNWEEIGKAIDKKMSKDSGVKTKSWMFCKPSSGGMSAFYGLGFLGALVYYLTTATTFWGAIVGILKALVWPAFFVYDVLKFIGA